MREGTIVSSTKRFRLQSATLTVAMAGAGVGVVAATPSLAFAASGQGIVTVAQNELNNSSHNYEIGNNCSFYAGQVTNWPACGGMPGWAGGTSDHNWCSVFVKYVWREAGVASYSEITTVAQSLRTYGEAHGTWHSRTSGYVPQPREALVYDFTPGTTYPIDHVGIVTSASGGALYTIE